MARLKERWRAKRPEVISGLLYQIVMGIGRTLRVETRGFDPAPERTIFCGWHGRSFPFAVHFRGRGVWVIISRSRDGEMQNAIFERLGFQIARGSTGRGGERAAVRTIKALRAGGALAMTPDGPRGPYGVVQEGVVLIAARSGSRLVPVGVASSASWTVSKSWDRYMVPKPFSRCLMIAGEPLIVPTAATPDEMEAIREQLQASIAHVQEEAERCLLKRSAAPLPATDR